MYVAIFFAETVIIGPMMAPYGETREHLMSDDFENLSMGCMIQHPVCSHCGEDTEPCEHVEKARARLRDEGKTVGFMTLSLVSVRPLDVEAVAKAVNVSTATIKAYLRSHQQNPVYTRAFWQRGVHPIGKK